MIAINYDATVLALKYPLTPKNVLRRVVGAVIIGIGIGACLGIAGIRAATTLQVAAFVGTSTATATRMPIPSPTLTANPTFTPMIASRPIATLAPQPSPTASAQLTPAPQSIAEHFLFGRPLALDAPGPVPNFHYLYGTTEHGAYEVHHGVDFDNNPIGAPVLAVGDGVIVSTGDDRVPMCGANGKQTCGRSLNYYGLVTVIRLDTAYRGRTLYALYGHQDRIGIQVGQRVKRGDVIGMVGMTGIALGPHVHLEIRIGANDYASTHNPMLWVAPLPGRGVLAGRYTDADGTPASNGRRIAGVVVDIYRVEEPTKFFRETETYSTDEYPAVNPDDELRENFLISDVPAGDYIVRVLGKSFAARVTVKAGKLAWVEIGE